MKQNSMFQRILAIALLCSLCATSVPMFATATEAEAPATTREITLDGDLSDWEGVHSEAVEDVSNGKKATFYAVLTEEGDLYLACDAYHDVYTTTAGTWWENTNFEFFINGSQSWVSAWGGGAQEAKVYDYVMNVQEINGETVYHTITEVLVPRYKFLLRDDGTIQLGIAWKTVGDDINAKKEDGSIMYTDNWWRPVGCYPNPGVLSVSKAGLYRDQTEAATAAESVTPIAGPTNDLIQNVPEGPGTNSEATWENNGTAYTLTNRGNDLGTSFNTWILGNTENTVTLSATFSGTQDGEQGFMFGVNNMNRSDIISEGEALYYLVDASVNNSRIYIGLERNAQSWAGWKFDYEIPKGSIYDDSFTLKASYSNGKIDIYINDVLVIAYTDPQPLPGTGYGLCSKTTNNTISDVTVSTEEVPVQGCYTVSTPDEFNTLIANANKVGKNYLRNQVVRITDDLDMTGTDFVPFNAITLTLDGQNHTISGINRVVNNVASGNYGILANELSNNNCSGTIRNVTLKNSSITVTSTATEAADVAVGAIAGLVDRGKTSGITLDNVTVTVNGIAYVGGIAGKREWSASDDLVSNISFKNVTVDAPDATVGILYGSANSDVNGEIANVTGAIRLAGAENEVTSETLIAVNASSKTIAETAKQVVIMRPFDSCDTTNNTLSTTGHSALAQLGTVNGQTAIRFLIVSNAEQVTGNTVKVIFTKLNGEEYVISRTVGENDRSDGNGITESYSKVMAAGEVFTAEEGCEIYGFVVYGNDMVFETVAVELITAEGEIYSTALHTYDEIMGGN
ncbi:MAG: hypothetical protein ACI3YK_04105 [Eubacteriales bacterium]